MKLLEGARVSRTVQYRVSHTIPKKGLKKNVAIEKLNLSDLLVSMGHAFLLPGSKFICKPMDIHQLFYLNICADLPMPCMP